MPTLEPPIICELCTKAVQTGYVRPTSEGYVCEYRAKMIDEAPGQWVGPMPSQE